ncbi:MAG TPA: class I SAM-dependent methyltransferase [Gemmatimonadales bacterium]|jgi:SAM-dependent methyltransferase
MVGKLLPKRLKRYLIDEFGWLMQVAMPDVLARSVPGYRGYLPQAPHSDCFAVPKVPAEGEHHPATRFQVPPKDLWLGYGQTEGDYLSSGRDDVGILSDLLGVSGTSFDACRRLLDFGCGAGRVTRWLDAWADRCEVWGTDISAQHISWCQQHLTPPLHFATTTIFPHLPFEDRYFDVIYAGSVFTHIDDLADAWFLELRRLLSPGGRLFLTVHDRKTVSILANADDTRWWVVRYRKQLNRYPDYDTFSRSDFGMFTIGRSIRSEVFYDVAFLERKLRPLFRVRSVTEQAYGYQTALVLERI